MASKATYSRGVLGGNSANKQGGSVQQFVPAVVPSKLTKAPKKDHVQETHTKIDLEQKQQQAINDAAVADLMNQVQTRSRAAESGAQHTALK